MKILRDIAGTILMIPLIALGAVALTLYAAYRHFVPLKLKG